MVLIIDIDIVRGVVATSGKTWQEAAYPWENVIYNNTKYSGIQTERLSQEFYKDPFWVKTGDDRPDNVTIPEPVNANIAYFYKGMSYNLGVKIKSGLNDKYDPKLAYKNRNECY